MTMTTQHGNMEITSEVTVSPDYRRAYVAGRRFDMMKHTGRAGAYGRRYTYTKLTDFLSTKLVTTY